MIERHADAVDALVAAQRRVKAAIALVEKRKGLEALEHLERAQRLVEEAVAALTPEGA